MSDYTRDFKGIWIPRDIWLSKDLTVMEKIFLVEIDSLDNSQGCFASNKYFSEFFDISKGRCTQIIKSLETKGFISIELERNGKQIVKRTIKVVRKLNTLVNILNNPSEKTKEGYLENDEENNTSINNTSNNNTNTKETPSSSSKNSLKENFDKLWKLYPKKLGKADAFKSYCKAIKEGVTNKQIQDGIINYKKQILQQNTKDQYIAHGSTWFNKSRWNDVYDVEINSYHTAVENEVTEERELTQEEIDKLMLDFDDLGGPDDGST